jgi:hypothetical protein
MSTAELKPKWHERAVQVNVERKTYQAGVGKERATEVPVNSDINGWITIVLTD